MYGEPEAYYTPDLDPIHADCMTVAETYAANAEGSEWIAVFGDESVDTPNHCERCGGLIDEPLTSYGELYVIGSIIDTYLDFHKTGKVNPVSGGLWIEAYADEYDFTRAIGEIVLETLADGPLDNHPAFTKYREQLPDREVYRAGGEARGTGPDTREREVSDT